MAQCSTGCPVADSSSHWSAKGTVQSAGQAETIQQKIMRNKMLPGACGIDALGASWELTDSFAAWRLGAHHKRYRLTVVRGPSWPGAIEHLRPDSGRTLLALLLPGVRCTHGPH